MHESLKKITVVLLALSMSPAASAQSQADEAAPESEKGASASGSSKRSSSNEISDLLKDLDYPELQVVPRASERLRIEAREEDRKWFYTHWPIEISGLATLAVGLQGKSQLRPELSESEKSDASTVATVTQAVGAGWLVAGVVLGLQKPYLSGLSSLSRFNGKDRRSVLLRERLAEEALEKPARIMRPLQVASVVTNAGMSVLMGRYMTDEGRLLAGVSAILAFLPFVFEDHTIRVYEKHLEYKKKIYGPLTSTGLGYDEKNQAFYPTTTLTWMF